MLASGQIIRYGPALYRVEHVNLSRAYIVPLTKKQQNDPNADAGGRGGVSISPNSDVPIITDLQRALDEMELAAVEAEILATKAELARRDDPTVTTVTMPQTAPKPAPKAEPHRRMPVKPGGGWYLTDAATPSFKEGTLAEQVWLWIGTNPGKSTADIVAGVKATGAVAACVSRFHQAGLIEKR